jgi:peptide/nickel transport system substrate-binding protein
MVFSTSLSGRFAPLALTAALALSAYGPSAQAEPLTLALGGSITSLDPHFHNATPNHVVSMHIFDRLIERQPDTSLKPSLAESWTPVSDTVWEFKLRDGVKWHDGKSFTADDVAFTIERAPNVPNSPAGFGGFVRAIQKVEVVDPLTLRFHTASPSPNLPRELAFVSVISRHAGEGATTEQYNLGKAAIGTGPYKFASYAPGDRVELVRNDDWFGAKQPWDKVTIRVITNPGARIAALLSGGVDVIDSPPATDLARLKNDPRVELVSVDGLRVIFLQLDRSRDTAVPFVTDAAGKPLEANPFHDKRVREALSIAVNREALADRVMQGTAVATGQWLPVGSYSYAPSVKSPAFDAERAKKLLADAGYPQGFQLTLHTPNDRYPGDASVAQAVASMWTRIGVKTAVEAQPWSTYSGRRAKLEYGASLGGWGSPTGEAGYLLTNILNSHNTDKRTGSANVARYSNSELDALTVQALSTMDDARREQLLVKAVETASADEAFLPLLLLRNNWGIRTGLKMEARSDERTLAMDIHPAKP